MKKICRILIFLLTGIFSVPLSGAVQYDAGLTESEFLSEQTDASEPGAKNQAVPAPGWQFHEDLLRDSVLPDLLAQPPRGQPLPGALLTLLTGLLLSGGLKRLFARKRRKNFGAYGSWKKSGLRRLDIPPAFCQVCSCWCGQKIVLRL